MTTLTVYATDGAFGSATQGWGVSSAQGLRAQSNWATIGDSRNAIVLHFNVTALPSNATGTGTVTVTTTPGGGDNNSFPGGWQMRLERITASYPSPPTYGTEPPSTLITLFNPVFATSTPQTISLGSIVSTWAAGAGYGLKFDWNALNAETMNVWWIWDPTAAGTANDPYVTLTYTVPPGPAGAITEPDVGSTYDASIVLTCGGATDPDTASGSLYYDWDYSTNGGASWTNIGLSAMGSLTKTWDCSALAAGTTFKVRVRPYDGANYGTYTTLGGNFSIVHTSKMKRWTGSAWVSHNLSRWNGTAWVATHLKRWTGSAWVDE